jgi:low temperature requirement protein LtrA
VTLIRATPTSYADALSDDTLGRRFKRWFWRPPRPHGEVIPDRTVSVLELFYDLVYVVVIAQAAHPLAEHVSTRTTAEFAVVFALIWTAWVNGSLYLELHGRQDGRTRSFVFVQMGVLVLLAVFTADAAGDGGRGFALVYAIFLTILTLLWNSVRLQDRRGHQEYVSAAGRYVALQAAAAVVMLVSAFLPDDARLLVWTVVAVASVACFAVLGRTDIIARGMPPTDSLVERFGLFTIVVLGEFVFGVVDGLSTPERDALTITTGMIALMIGFGFWWLYFDLIGRRPPRRESGAIATWLLGHLRRADTGEHCVVALGRRCVEPAGARPDRRDPRRRRATRGRLPTAQLCPRRGSGCCASRRLGAPDTVALRVIAGGHPGRAVVLRRQPVPCRRRLAC